MTEAGFYFHPKNRIKSGDYCMHIYDCKMTVLLFIVYAVYGIICPTLSDFIWADIKWALALAPILMSARIKSAHSKVRQNFLVEKYF